jgi:acyl transferase domain-containing protein/pimeloyl-ACP methyl ester carboxylesterase/short-subunit dehydrogenase/aryl carrier-like protein
MSEVDAERDNRALLQKALVELREMRSRLKVYDQAKREPIAVVGMGCRFPGADDTEAFWKLLSGGVDAIREIPPDRWDLEYFYHPDPEQPGKTYSRHGGFVDGIRDFDAHFFGMSPREAASLDPQQRMLLEVSWEAMESAGLAPDSMFRSRTGVFVGVSSFEFALSLGGIVDWSRIDPYFGTGSALSSCAGRLSYFLGLTGPSISVDTACSSSLVSVHLACQSLRLGECDTALAAGVNILMSPLVNLAFAKARMLAPDGRCKTFDARADGYVRGEGCGVVVLKRLSSALAEADPILAVIPGSAVNQDGPSGALTVPSGPSQQAVIRQALANAGVQPNQIDYVEAHGTGTALGDPIEVSALAAVFGDDRTIPLVIGSVKTNFGHLEAAAGIASLIKVVLSLRQSKIPPNLHFISPSPHIAWDRMRIDVPTQLEAWPCNNGNVRTAGISSFGFTGTNAHLILQEAPPVPARPIQVERPVHLLTLSAKTREALGQMIYRSRDYLRANPSLPLADICHTAAVGRSHFPHRLSVVGDSNDQICQRLGEFISRESTDGSKESIGSVMKPWHAGSLGAPGRYDRSEGLSVGKAAAEQGRKLTFVFGHGHEYTNMGRSLYEEAPVFRQALQECEEQFRGLTDRSLLDVIYPPEGGDCDLLGRSAFAEPALLAVQYGIVRLLKSWGVEPDAVAGQGVGEYAAALSAGIFSMPDAFRLVVEQGRPSVALGNSETTPGALPGLERIAREVTYSNPLITLISGLTGKPASPAVSTPEYWIRPPTMPAKAGDFIRSLSEQGYRHLIQIGPAYAPDAFNDMCRPEGETLWLPTLASSSPDWHQLLETLGTLYTLGFKIDWRGFDSEYCRRRVLLPTYPFQREKCWPSSPRELPRQLSRQIEDGVVPGDWFYVEAWHPTVPSDVGLEARSPALPAVDKAALDEWTSPLWLILSDRNGQGRRLAAMLEGKGKKPVLCFIGGEWQQIAKGEFCLDPADLSGFRRLLEESTGHNAPRLEGIVYLWGLDSADLEFGATDSLWTGVTRACRGLLNLVQTLCATSSSCFSGLWIATRGAQRVIKEEPLALPEIAQSSLSGLGRVIVTELPEMRCRLIDLDPIEVEGNASALLLEINRSSPSSQGADLVAFRGGQRFVCRLVRYEESARPQPVLSPDATYLVSGGLGAIGLRVAEWLVARGARSLVLVNRSQATEQALSKVSELENKGAEVKIVSADVSDPQQVANLVTGITGRMPPLRGVFHCAGVLEDGSITKLSWQRFEAVLAPKVKGAWTLHLQTIDKALDFFVLFSSAASLVGPPGLAGYASANSFLDAIAHYRRGLGLAALSINWGPWQSTGMAKLAGSTVERLWAMLGADLLPPALALDAMGRLLSSDVPQLAVLSVRWSKARGIFPDSGLPPYYELVAEEPARVVPEHNETESPVFHSLLEMRPDQRPVFLSQYMSETISGVLRDDPDQLRGDTDLTQIGIDSLMIMELMNKFHRDLGFVLYPRELYERPTIDQLAPYLAAEFGRLHDGWNHKSHTPAQPVGAGRLSIADNGNVDLCSQRAEESKEGRLPGAVFILCSPRSGSTLLRVMLAGHPALFAPPELHLLPFISMDERRKRLSGTHLNEGLERALMELKGFSADDAKALAGEWADDGISVRQVYKWVQSLCGDRLLVDKSPSYAAEREILERAERLFDGAKYIHLVRHPVPMIESFVRMRMDRLIGAGSVDPYWLAEECWALSNNNILELAGQSADRYHLVRFEELVQDPAAVMMRLCKFLCIPFHPAVLTPYEGNRMTDGLYGPSAPVGDPNFLKRHTIDPRPGQLSNTVTVRRELGETTRTLAAAMGYELPARRSAGLAQSVSGPELTTMRERYVNIRGLELCLCEWGPEDGALVLALHGMLEQGAVWDETASQLVPKGFRVVAPDLRGHGRSAHVGAGGAYHLEDFVADIDGLVGCLAGNEPFAVVGHSFGSALAVLFAAARPKEVGALILAEPPLLGGSPAPEGAGLNGLVTYLDRMASKHEHSVFSDRAEAARRIRAATPSLSEEMALKLAERVTEPRGSGWCWRWDPMLGSRGGIALGSRRYERDMPAILKRIQAPVTVICGRESPYNARRDGPHGIHQRQETLARAGVRLESISGGHSLHLDNPEDLARLIIETYGSSRTPQEPLAAPLDDGARDAHISQSRPRLRVIARSLVFWIRLLWELPLAPLSFLYFRYMRALVGYGLNRELQKESGRRWMPLSAELLAMPWATWVFATMGPRWNTHAAVASAGPIDVKKQLSVNVAAAKNAAKSWAITVYTFPEAKTIARIGSIDGPFDSDWETISLLPGRYSLALRYYEWRVDADLPEVMADGALVLERSMIWQDINEFYADLRNSKSWLYTLAHYYVFVMLRCRRCLPGSFVRREYLPVGDANTFFLYDYVRKGESLSFDIDSALLAESRIYFTLYDRASFPVVWYRVTKEHHETSRIEQDGFYLVRIPETDPEGSGRVADSIRVTAKPSERPAITS